MSYTLLLMIQDAITMGYVVAQLVKNCDTNRKVAGSFSGGAIDKIFPDAI